MSTCSFVLGLMSLRPPSLLLVVAVAGRRCCYTLKLLPYLREYKALYSKIICLGFTKMGRIFDYKARPYIRMTGGCSVQYSHVVLYYCVPVFHSLAHLGTSRLTCAICFCSNIRSWLYNQGWPSIRIYSRGLILA